MMRRLAALFFLCAISSCHRNTSEKLDNVARYQTDDGQKILLTDGKRSYSGTKYLPPGSNPLQDFGSAVRTISIPNVRCIVLDNLTFAVSAAPKFTCNGFTFQVRDKSERALVIRASCESLSVGGCQKGDSRGPRFEYEYAYIPDQGVEWIRFVSEDPKVPGDILHHIAGSRVLAR